MSCPTTSRARTSSNDYGFDPHEQEHATYHGHGRRHQRARPMGVRVDGRDPGPHAASTSASPTRRSAPTAASCGRRSTRRQSGGTAADGARAASGAAHHRPAGDRRHRPDRRLAGLLAQDRRAASARPRAGRTATRVPSCPRANAAGTSFVERHGAVERRAVQGGGRGRRGDRGRTSSRSCASRSPISTACCAARRIVASDAARVMRNGVTATTTLLAKDTSHRTVFPVFTAGGGFGMPEMEGGGDFLLIADPTTFRVLPWAPQHRLAPVRHLLPERQAGAVLHAAALSRRSSRGSPTRGFDYMAGLEVEFHLFELEDPRLAPEDATWPGEPPDVEPHRAGLPAPDRGALRPGRSDRGAAAARRRGARPAAALGRARVRPEPVRIHLRAAGRPRAGRHDGAVPQRREADRAAQRPACDLHVPARACPTRFHQRLAPASVAARSNVVTQTLSRPTIDLLSPLGALVPRRAPRARARGGRVHHADAQRLQALPSVPARARSARSGRATIAA